MSDDATNKTTSPEAVKELINGPAIRPRRRLVPTDVIALNTQKNASNNATVIPSLDGLMQDALVIVGRELAQYKTKVTAGRSLDLKEARVVQGYMETLTKLSKEQRDAARSEDLSNLSNEELLQLATELTKRPKLSMPDNEE